MRLTTLVNDPSEHRYTRFKLTKGNYTTEAVLTSRSSATSLRYPEINGRGMNSVPHQRCMGTGNSIWTSRTHQVRRPLLHQVVRIKALPVGKHPTKFLRAEAQPYPRLLRVKRQAYTLRYYHTGFVCVCERLLIGQ